MKVFISWSGEMSHKVALALKAWLPCVIQDIEAIESDDFSKGIRWNGELMEDLKDTNYGIICVTPYNIDAPWLNFEAGAISNTINQSLVSPLLFRVDRSSLQGPLSQFQSTICDKEDIFKLLTSINEKLDHKIKEENLRGAFEMLWDNLCKELNDISNAPDSYKGKSGSYDWIYSMERLKELEKGEKIKSVLIIARNIVPHALDPTIRHFVKDNIARGISYRFIIPSDNSENCSYDINKFLVENLGKQENPDKLDIRSVSEKEFNSQAITDYILINPEEDDEYTLQAFLQLPVKGPETWISVEYNAGLGLKERFINLWNRGKIIKMDNTHKFGF